MVEHGSGVAMEALYKVKNTPLSFCIYSVEKTPTRMHEDGVLEIIFCLKGSVKISYVYAEFTINAGEYISIDKDAYFLYDGNDNVCVSFFIDLRKYEKIHPSICKRLFICEGLAETVTPYPTEYHNMLKGILIAMLRHIIEKKDWEKIAKQTDKIIDIFVNHFDIFFYRDKKIADKQEALKRMQIVNAYMRDHYRESITLSDLAEELNFTENYLSEYLRKISLGFRNVLGYIRVNESEKYLLRSTKTIVEISDLCGFSDVRYYYQAFKRNYNCTPRQFRMKYSNQKEAVIKYLPLEAIKELVDEIMAEHYMQTFMGD